MPKEHVRNISSNCSRLAFLILCILMQSGCCTDGGAKKNIEHEPDNNGIKPDIELTLIPFSPDEANDDIIARFSNKSKTDLNIVRPLPEYKASEKMPKYVFHVINSNGKTLQRRLRVPIGSSFGWIWPVDYRIKIPPGKYYDMRLIIPFRIPKLSEYKVSLEYIFKEPETNNVQYPIKNAWVGKLKTDIKTATLAPLKIKRIIKDDDILMCSDLNEVTDIDAAYSELTDKGLQIISELPRIRGLYLNGSKVTDNGLKHLQKLRHLRVLNLGIANISNTGIQYLSKVSSLKDLNLGSTKITDCGIRSLRSLINIERLTLYGTSIGDRGLEGLKGLRLLNYLSIGKTNVTDVGIMYLMKFERLRGIEVSSTKITAEGILKLKDLPVLMHLFCSRGQFSKKDKDRIKKHMPMLNIYDK